MKLNFLLILRAALGLFTFGVAGRWWQKATHDFRDWDRSKPDEVTHRDILTEEQLGHYTKEAKTRFADVIQSYTQRDKQLVLTAEELKFAKGRIEFYEKLAELHTASGFYAAAFKDHATNKTIMAIAGGDFSEGLKPFLLDVDDMFMSTSGGSISQLPDAVKFAEDVQARFGKIDIIAGHSTGAYLALYLTGSGKCPQVRCFAYDPPNVTHAMIDNCAELGNISKSQVINNFKNNCMTISITPNSYNTLGAPPGISLIANNDPNPWYALVPRMHIYADDEFIPALQQIETMVQKTDDSPNYGPTIITTLLLLTSALAFKPELQQGLKKSAAAFRS